MRNDKFEYPYNVVQEVLRLDDSNMEQFLKLCPQYYSQNVILIISQLFENSFFAIESYYRYKDTVENIAEDLNTNTNEVIRRMTAALNNLRNNEAIYYGKLLDVNIDFEDRIPRMKAMFRLINSGNLAKAFKDKAYRQITKLERKIKAIEEEEKKSLEDSESRIKSLADKKQVYEERLKMIEKIFGNQNLLTKKIHDFGFSRRLERALINYGCGTGKDLVKFCALSYDDALKVMEIGNVRLAEVIIILKKYEVDPLLFDFADVVNNATYVEQANNVMNKEQEVKLKKEQMQREKEMLDNSLVLRDSERVVALSIVKEALRWSDKMIDDYRKRSPRDFLDTVQWILDEYLTVEEKRAILVKHRVGRVDDNELVSKAYQKLNVREVETMIFFGRYLYCK